MTRLVLAATCGARLRGLLGRRSSDFGPDAVLALAPCASIHTFGMREAIDVAFVGADGVVLQAAEDVAAGRLLRCPKAVVALERFASGTTQPWYAPGDALHLVPPHVPPRNPAASHGIIKPQ